MFRKRKLKINQYIGIEQDAWKYDKKILLQNCCDDHTISIGYATHSMEDYEELVPLVLDVAESILRDCTVFTWIKTSPVQTAVSHSLWPFSKSAKNDLPNLAAQYASENHPEFFLTGTAKSLPKHENLTGRLCSVSSRFQIAQQPFSIRFTDFIHPRSSTTAAPMKISCFLYYTRCLTTRFPTRIFMWN